MLEKKKKKSLSFEGDLIAHGVNRNLFEEGHKIDSAHAVTPATLEARRKISS